MIFRYFGTSCLIRSFARFRFEKSVTLTSRKVNLPKRAI